MMKCSINKFMRIRWRGQSVMAFLLEERDNKRGMGVKGV
jgi:hypothetical protein